MIESNGDTKDNSSCNIDTAGLAHITEFINVPENFEERVQALPNLKDKYSDIKSKSKESWRRQMEKRRPKVESLKDVFLSELYGRDADHFRLGENVQIPLILEEAGGDFTFDDVVKGVPQEMFKEDPEDYDVLRSEYFSQLCLSKTGIDLPSHYLDAIEMSLVRQIQSHSEFFFQALINLQDLHLEITQMCSAVRDIRSSIHEIKPIFVDKSLQLVRNARRRKNLVKLDFFLQRMYYVLRSQQRLKMLLSTASYGAAIDLIYKTQAFLEIDLLEIKCLRNVHTNLLDILPVVQTQICDEFIRICLLPVARDNMTFSSKEHDAERISEILTWLVYIDKLDVVIEPLHGGFKSLIKADIKSVLAQQLKLVYNKANDAEMDTNDIVDSQGDSTDLLLLAKSLQHSQGDSTNLPLLEQSLHRTQGDSADLPLHEKSPRHKRTCVSSSAVSPSSSQSSNSSSAGSSTGKRRSRAISTPHALPVKSSKIERQPRKRASTPNTRLEFQQLDENRKAQLKSLSRDQFMAVSKDLFERLLWTLDWVNTIISTIKVSFRRLQDNDEDLEFHLTREPDTRIVQLKSMDSFKIGFRDLLVSLCEYAHLKCVKIIRMRSKGRVKPHLLELQNLCNCTNSFIEQSEKMCGRDLLSLRNVLNTQTHDFLQHLHETQLLNIDRALEMEDWTQADIPTEFQQLIDCGFLSQTGQERELCLPERYEEVSGKSKPATHFIIKIQDETKKEPCVTAETISVVYSVLVLLKAVAQYLECFSRFSSVTNDIPFKIVELLSEFNSKTYELVLGAGAMHFSGFDLLTTSHISLAAQCLGLIISQIRPIQMAVVCLSSNEDSIDKFEQVIMEYENHRRDLFSKIVAQMKRLAFEAFSDLVDSSWAQKVFKSRSRLRAAPVCASNCVVELMDRTSQIHKGLSQYLPVKRMQQIFKETAELFCTIFCKFISKIDLTDDLVRQNVSLNAKYVLEILTKLSCSENVRRRFEQFIT